MNVLCNACVPNGAEKDWLTLQGVWEIQAMVYTEPLSMLVFFIADTEDALYMEDVKKDRAIELLRAMNKNGTLDLLNEKPLILGPADLGPESEECDGDCDHCEFADICDEMGREEDQAPFTDIIPINPKNGGSNKPVH